MIIQRTAKDTLTAIELNVDDELHFTLADGQTRKVKLLNTVAYITSTTLDGSQLPLEEKPGAVTHYTFRAQLEIDGSPYTLVRYVADERSFYEPWLIAGMHLWLDAVDKIFDFLIETHGPCRPTKDCRLAIQDATLRACPVRLHPWCPLPPGRLRAHDAYNGEDVWMGPYFGASAHGGLDINHPAGTPIWAPLSFHDHNLFDSVAKGDNNNRWQGVHRWPNGDQWILGVCHISRLHVPEHQPIEAGSLIADGAGCSVGSHEHSHFTFTVRNEANEEIHLDPWILFWQMYRDHQSAISGGEAKTGF